jgi:hypothetical protein
LTGNYFKINLSNKDYRIIRTEKRFFDITYCRQQPLIDGQIDSNDGIMLDAVEVPVQEVADLVTEVEIRQKQLQDVETLLREWNHIRRAGTRKSKSGKFELKKEVAK